MTFWLFYKIESILGMILLGSVRLCLVMRGNLRQGTNEKANMTKKGVSKLSVLGIAIAV